MDKHVRGQTGLDQRDRCSGDFAALFAQLDRPDAIAPIEGGLLRLLGSIDAAKRGRGKC